MFFRKSRAALGKLTCKEAADRNEVTGRDEVVAAASSYLEGRDVFWGLIDLINDIPLDNAEEISLSKMKRWCETARPELIEIALDIIAHPADSLDDWNMMGDAARYYMEDFVLDWARFTPIKWAEKAGPLLGNAEMRPIVLSVMGNVGYGSAAFRPWLKPFVLNPLQLRHEEQMNLVSAIGQAYDEEALQLLSQLAANIETGQHEVMKAIQNMRKFMDKEMNGA